MPTSCSARSRQTGRCSASAMASARWKASRAAVRSRSRAILPMISRAWQRTSGLAAAASRAVWASSPACPRSSPASASSAARTSMSARRRGPRAGLFQPLRGFQVRAGDWPAGGGDRGPRELDVDVRRASGGRGVRDQPLAEPQRLVGVAGECQAAEQQALGARPGGGIGEQDGGAPERSGGGGQGAAIQGRLARGGEQRTGPRGVPRPCGQVGGDVPPRPVEGGVRRVHSGERGFRQPAAARRQLPVDDGLAGERVPEPEDLAVDGHQLGGDGALQGRGDGAVRHGGGGRQQLPVEAAAKQRGRLEHPPFFRAERGQPGADGLGEGRGHARRGEHLLDEERHAVGCSLGPQDQLVVGPGDAGTDHVLDRVGVQPLERQVPGGAPARQPPRQAGGRFRLVPAGGDAQHALAAEVVRQILKERQGVRIGPVQVLEGDDQPGAGAGTEPAEQPDDRLCPGDRRGEAGRGRVAPRRPS